MSIDKVVYIGKRRDDVVNAPVPLAALGMARQPGATHFRRNHFPVPALDAGTWALAIGGAVAGPRVLAAADLRAFEHRTLPGVLECAGHRRDEFDPPASGLRWGAGAASEAHWTGVPLAAVLEAAGISDDASRSSCAAPTSHGEVQPQRPLPNAGGYCNNAVHRIGVTADEGKEVV